jgi:hypothetical protein
MYEYDFPHGRYIMCDTFPFFSIPGVPRSMITTLGGGWDTRDGVFTILQAQQWLLLALLYMRAARMSDQCRIMDYQPFA